MEKKKYKLFGTTWTLKKVDSTTNPDGDWAYGCTFPTQRLIEISTKDDKGKLLPEQEVRITTMHEIIHSIFETGQYLQSNLDEPQVEWLARCLITLIDQGVFDL